MLIEGVFAAVPTPFYPDERVYFRKLEANVGRYSRSLLAGMVVLGSTGEAVALTDAESRDVFRAVSESAAPDKVLIAGVGRESVKATLEMAEAAARYNFDAVLVRTPTYYAPQMTSERSCSITFPSSCPTTSRSNSWPNLLTTPTSSASRTRAAASTVSGRSSSLRDPLRAAP